ncbi:MAG: delta(1)-pyrroline-2-carboxylate reductase family protein [Steroidobacteraceae bacterium]
MSQNANAITIRHDSALPVFDQACTAELLGYRSLIDALADAAREYDAGAIRSPERMAVPIGPEGMLLSMPATASDIGIHKLVSIQPGNARRGLPTIHGIVTVCDAATGRPLFLLDGPEVTGRRTAAITLLAIRELAATQPREVVLFGTGAQARHHVQAFSEVYPEIQIWVRGRNQRSAAAFSENLRHIHRRIAPCPDAIPDSVGAVIMLTSSTEPLYDEPARHGRLVIGVGAFQPDMAEIGEVTLNGSVVCCDDVVGARVEAGDLLRAGVDWTKVHSLGSLLRNGRNSDGPFVFKSVGTGVWDLAASRVAAKSVCATPP